MSKDESSLTKRQLQKIKTRQRILEAADKCFSKKGMKYTQIKDICDEADVSVGTFYHYFENIESLILYNFNKFDQPYIELTDDDFSKEEALENLIDFSLYFARDAFLTATREKTIEYLKARLSVTIESLRPVNRPYFKILIRIITVGQSKNQIRKDISPEEIADLVMIITRGYTFDWANMDGDYDLKEKMEKHLAIIYSSFSAGN